MKKYFSHRGILLGICAVAVVGSSAAAIVYASGNMEKREKIYRQNLARVEELDKIDVASLQKQLNELGEEEEQEVFQAGEILDDVGIKQAFQGTAIVGDSITESIVEYGFLDADVVISKRGLSILDAGEQLETAVNLAPRAVFLAFGTNDLEIYNGDAESFQKAYSEKIQWLKEQLPDVPVYVNSILPVQQSAIEETESLAYYGAFNDALSEMCQELSCTFIDNTPLVENDDDIYEPDGEHVTAEYYPKWLTHMAETAGLV